MFSYSKIELSSLAKELNFVRDTLEKVIRLSEILDYINSNPIMKHRLALKGGTAINLTVFNLPRLSVDIDLDYCVNNSREEMLENRKEITEDLIKFMKTQGYEISSNSRNKHSLDSLVFTYQNMGGMKDNIKIEINYSLRNHLFELEEKGCLSDSIKTKNKILTLNVVELFAAKINALLSRSAIRDFYDVYNMIEYKLFNILDLELLRKSVVFYTVVSQEVIPELYDLSIIDRINSRKIRSELLPVIKKGTFVKLDDMKEVVKDFLSKLLDITENEKNFLDLFKQKVYKPDLLFNDAGILNRIKDHYMIAWKLQDHNKD